MTEEKKIELLAETFDLEPEDLAPEMKLEDLEEWDSMAKLSLIVLMDDECGKTPTSDEIKAFETIADIMAYME